MKNASLLLALALALTAIFSGCSGSGSKVSAEESVSAAVSAVESATPMPEETPEAAMKVGFIYVEAADDGGFSSSHEAGRLYLETQLGVETAFRELIPETDQVEGAIDDLVAQGCSVIFGCSYGYMDYMENKAAEYPDVVFLHFGGYKSNGGNFVNYNGRMYQARFLTGLVAGMTTESGQIGYVAAYPTSDINGGLDAFALGVAAVNPEATVEVPGRAP